MESFMELEFPGEKSVKNNPKVKVKFRLQVKLVNLMGTIAINKYFTG
jgi:hypothetical protein